MAQQDDLINLIKDVAAPTPVPQKKTAAGNPTTEAIAAGYGSAVNANQASPTKVTSKDEKGRFVGRTFFSPIPPEVRNLVDPSDPGGGLDVMAVVFMGGPEGGDAPLSVFKWPQKGSIVS